MFILLLTYQSSLREIEAALPAHQEYLDRHYKTGCFLASGPQIPRTGGVILCQGLTREAIESIIQEDPFYQQKLADYSIIEFEAKKMQPAIQAMLASDC